MITQILFTLPSNKRALKIVFPEIKCAGGPSPALNQQPLFCYTAVIDRANDLISYTYKDERQSKISSPVGTWV